MTIPDPQKEHYITVQSVANRLSRTDNHVYDLIREGNLQAFKIGKRAIRISESSLDKFISANIINPDDYYAPADPEPEKQDPQPAGTARSKWMSK